MRINGEFYNPELVNASLELRQFYNKRPAELTPSEADLVEALNFYGLPPYGTYRVCADAAIRRKQVVSEIEEEIFPVLSTVLSDSEVEEMSEVDRKWFEDTEYDALDCAMEEYEFSDNDPSAFEFYLLFEK